jgi:dihydroorotase/N-acyl-D-amino-acid deacylase
VSAASVAPRHVAIPSQPAHYDLIITDARIVDGTGAPWARGDIAVTGDRIAAMGDLPGATADRRIDAHGLVASPGFIDVQGQSEFNLLVDNRGASKITQGVTTEITGEGNSIAPATDGMLRGRAGQDKKYGVTEDWHTLAEYLRRLEQRKPAINLGTFVGAGTIREYVIGRDNRPATPAELDRMRQLVAHAMEDGAFGVSSALEYVPDQFASTDELVALAAVAHRYGGVYFTHQRSESDRIMQSLNEVFTIARRAEIPATIWHLKAAYRENFGRMPAVLRRLDSARTVGLDIAASVYPYARASNGLVACFPPWSQEGGTDKLLERLRDSATRTRIKAAMVETNTPWENEWLGSGGGDGIWLSDVVNPALAKYEGMTFTEIGRAMGKDPRDAAMDVALADRGASEVVIAIMDERDVQAAVTDPIVTYGSDSPARAEDGPLSTSKSHPRGFGTFPRVLAKYVREQHAMRLEEAVRKMTSLAAARVGLLDRGILRPGMMADIAVFDPNTIRDVATFTDPNHYSAGVADVLVNGRAVILDGQITDERPGRALRGPGYQRPETSSK